MKQHDDKIKKEVKQTLLHQLQQSGEGIEVEVKNGEVVLTGVVDVLAEKQAAEVIAAGVPGVRRVENDLTVAMDGQVSDTEVALSVQQKIEEDTPLSLHDVSVQSAHGVVTLQGEVDSAGLRQAAAAAAAEARGVKEIHNQLKVSRTKDDASITNEVELALSRADRVSPRDVSTSTRKGKVTLQGRVDMRASSGKLLT